MKCGEIPLPNIKNYEEVRTGYHIIISTIDFTLNLNYSFMFCSETSEELLEILNVP